MPQKELLEMLLSLDQEFKPKLSLEMKLLEDPVSRHNLRLLVLQEKVLFADLAWKPKS